VGLVIILKKFNVANWIAFTRLVVVPVVIENVKGVFWVLKEKN
jgi:hypothetical protein